jgi:CHAT domain-containing protein
VARKDNEYYADLLVLTACWTGPDGRISGECTVGMASIFQYAAARILLMNLWSVAEAASGTVPQPRLFGTCGS